MAVSSKMDDDNKMGMEGQQQQKDSKPMMKASAAVPMPQHSSSSSSNTKTTPMPKMHGMGGNKDKKKANCFIFGKTVEPKNVFKMGQAQNIPGCTSNSNRNNSCQQTFPPYNRPIFFGKQEQTKFDDLRRGITKDW